MSNARASHYNNENNKAIKDYEQAMKLYPKDCEDYILRVLHSSQIVGVTIAVTRIIKAIDLDYSEASMKNLRTTYG